MEIQYLFSKMKIGEEESHILRVKSLELINLPIGIYQSLDEYSTNMKIHHDFKISKLLKRDIDAEGNHYVWYVLSEHTKTIERSSIAATTAQNTANIDYMSMILGIDLPDEGGTL